MLLSEPGCPGLGGAEGPLHSVVLVAFAVAGACHHRCLHGGGGEDSLHLLLSQCAWAASSQASPPSFDTSGDLDYYPAL